MTRRRGNSRRDGALVTQDRRRALRRLCRRASWRKMGSGALGSAVIGRAMPRILRAAGPQDEWAAALGRATTLGFDTLLLPPGAVSARLAEAADGLGVALLSDVDVGFAPDDAVAGPFTRLPRPSLDPRAPVVLAEVAQAAIGSMDDAAALAAAWAPRLRTMNDTGVAGVRLLGLDTLPGWAVAPFLSNLRAACPDLLLFGWTPGVSRTVLESLAPQSLDLVGFALPAWDHHSDRLWRELELMGRIAPVVAEAGADPASWPLASVVSEGWMAPHDAAEAEALNHVRNSDLAGLAWSRLVSPPGTGTVVLRTNVPDARHASRAALCAVGPRVAASTVLQAIDGHFERFARAGETVTPGSVLDAEGGLAVFMAQARPEPVRTGLSRKRTEAAAEVSRVAIEAPTPCVDGGRFPARLVVGSLVRVEADIVTDGHDHLAAVVRWRGPGQDEWHEVPMAPVVNDRWAGAFPLERLGTHEYVVEAWRDIYGSYVDELGKKHAAGVPITLELLEGSALVKAAAERAKKPIRIALLDVIRTLEQCGPDARRAALLSTETQSLMAQADERPHRVATSAIPVQAERAGAAFASWYEVFPRSMSDDLARHGTFRDVVRHLPRIQAMGFDVLYFPPIHPIGRTNRKGPNNTLTPGPDDPGSPYAIGAEEGGHDALHPELGSLEDFQHLRMAAARHGIELAIDFAIQCSPDHPWIKQHKGWFDWRPDGTIKYAENPPKKYQDIVNVDFYAEDAVPELWLALANAVLFWAEQGVRLFRVDNPHTKPLPFWEWMIAEVQARYPDAVFLAEAFTRPKVMYRLAKVGFSQSYTYFTWRNTKAEFEAYLTELADGPPRDFFRPHFFVNTPDINPVPLQTAPRGGFLTRAALAATLSGLWGVYCGFELCDATPLPGREEYLDSEKYQVRKWDWGRPGNIEREIGVLNAIRKRNPALHTHLGVTFLKSENDQVLVFEKATPDRSNVVLVAINLDLQNPQSSRIEVPFWRWALDGSAEPAALDVQDLVQDRADRWTEKSRVVTLTGDQPYAIWRLTPTESQA